MDNNQKLIRGIAAAIVVLGLAFVVYKFIPRGPRPFSLGKNSPCPDKREMVMQDYYMRGIIEKDHRYTALINYYACNPIQKGDYVLYRFAPNVPPVVRIVRAVEGDKFELKKDKKRKAWNIFINGDLLVVGNEAHFFGTDVAIPPLGLALASRRAGLLPGDVALFSSWAPGDLDSSIFGLANIEDIIGKVEVIPGQYPAGYVAPYSGTKTPEELASEGHKEVVKPHVAPAQPTSEAPVKQEVAPPAKLVEVKAAPAAPKESKAKKNKNKKKNKIEED